MWWMHLADDLWQCRRKNAVRCIVALMVSVALVSCAVAPKPVVPAQTTLYLTGDNEAIAALDAQHGTALWSSTGIGVAQPPIVAGAVLYTAGYLDVTGSAVYALNRTDGTIRWRSTLAPAPWPEGLLLVGQTLYALTSYVNGGASTGAHDSEVFALDATNGHVLWRHTLSGESTASPQLLGGQLYVASSPTGGPSPIGSLVALDPRDGAERWRVSLTGDPYSAPVLAGGLVALSVDGGWVAAFHPDTGAVSWRVHPPGWEAGVSVVATDGHAIFVAAGRTFSALGAATGAVRWRQTVEGSPETNHQMYAPAIVDGNLFGLSGNDSYVYALDPASGAIRWRYDDHQYHRGEPVASHGLAYFIEVGGSVVALRERDGALAARIDGDRTYPMSLAVAAGG